MSTFIMHVLADSVTLIFDTSLWQLCAFFFVFFVLGVLWDMFHLFR